MIAPYLTSIAALCTLSAYIAIHHLVVALRRPDLRTHRIFGLLTSVVALHNGFIMLRQWVPSDEYLVTDRLLWSTEIASAWLLLVFVLRFCDIDARRTVRLTGLALLPFMLALLVRPGGFAYSETHGWTVRTLPWGEQVRTVAGTLSPAYVAFIAIVLAIFVGCLVTAWSAWRREGTGRPLALLCSLSILFAAVINSIAHDITGFTTVPVIDHAFVAVCLIMNLSMTDEIVRAGELAVRLQRAERLETLGRLAAGVAHDFNNILAGVIGAAELLALRLTGEEKLREKAELIISAGERAAGLSRRLGDFGRTRTGATVVVDVHAVIHEVEMLLRSSLGGNLRMRMHLAAPSAQVRADPALLSSLFLNLGLNARDAMPDGGVLTMTTANATPDAAERGGLRLPLADGPCLLVVVSDTGTGMAPEVLARLFEPYHSTKGAAGTCLGLVQVREALRDCGGSLGIVTAQEQGTSFRIWLPLAPPMPD